VLNVLSIHVGLQLKIQISQGSAATNVGRGGSFTPASILSGSSQNTVVFTV